MTAMNLFSLDYAVLLVAFIIVEYNVFKAPDDDNRNYDRGAIKKAETGSFLKVNK
jgi:hypothetical protein